MRRHKRRRSARRTRPGQQRRVVVIAQRVPAAPPRPATEPVLEVHVVQVLPVEVQAAAERRPVARLGQPVRLLLLLLLGRIVVGQQLLSARRRGRGRGGVRVAAHATARWAVRQECAHMCGRHGLAVLLRALQLQTAQQWLCGVATTFTNSACGLSRAGALCPPVRLPHTAVVKKTTASVVLTTTLLFQCRPGDGMLKASANAMAPRRPANHMRICMRPVILVLRRRFASQLRSMCSGGRAARDMGAQGGASADLMEKTLHARETRQNTMVRKMNTGSHLRVGRGEQRQQQCQRLRSVRLHARGELASEQHHSHVRKHQRLGILRAALP